MIKYYSIPMEIIKIIFYSKDKFFGKIIRNSIWWNLKWISNIQVKCKFNRLIVTSNFRANDIIGKTVIIYLK